MKRYFTDMARWGRALKPKELDEKRENAQEISAEETRLAEAAAAVRNAGIPAEVLHKRGQQTAEERIRLLIDPGTFLPLNTLYDPHDNEEGTTGVVTGLAAIKGKYAVVVASDNKVLAGAWIPGQPEKIFRAQDLAERLRIPLCWLLQCSGVKLTRQETVYPGRRSGGRIFFRNAELAQQGVPIIVGVFGTNPAGGGYHAISPAVIFAQKDANLAVGGAGILSGMQPQGGFDEAAAERIADAAKKFKEKPPGGAVLHHEQTGFVKAVFDTEAGVIEAMQHEAAGLPAFAADHFRVAAPAAPSFPPEELRSILPFNQRRGYDMDQVLARLFDQSEHAEYRGAYGPEVYCGLAKLDGLAVAVVANRQGFLPQGYPAYADYPGIGGKLYREGLIKMSEFTALCGRDKLPMIWFQDTTGIDVGDPAEKAEVLGLGQTLIYSIEDAGIPMATVVLRKGHAAAHYVMGGPQGNRNNVFTLGTAATEIVVMHGETAATAAFASRLVKEQDAGRSLEPVIAQMNDLLTHYEATSKPLYCAKHGLVDEVVPLDRLRTYLAAFAGAAYQHPAAFCPPHQMVLPRTIKG